MTIKMFEARRRIALASLLATVSLAGHAQLPDGDFACQVVTDSGQSGLVLVQADLESDAARTAKSVDAWEMDGGKGKTMSVVQCIAVPGETFRDTWFNSFYEKFPL